MKLNTADAVYREIGKRIQAARKQRGMSQEDLAEASALDRTHVGFIEQGRRKPTISTLFKMTQALGTSLERLFKGL